MSRNRLLILIALGVVVFVFVAVLATNGLMWRG
jgi:hypothetical protein